ncbi:MAG TPA: plastocyanin/azurin family copper-binding protein [Gemmatimonadales bacterium]|nr:plastocyanin/azurin family copper-binding protein [Gemmatimonadales bacterium]
MPAYRLLRLGLLAVLLAPLAACSDDGDTGPLESALVLALAPTKNGDQQQGVAGEPLASALQVIVTRDGEPVGDVAVQWGTADAGSLTPSTSNTDAEGIAQSAWTLGPEVGEQTASARVDGADGSPARFTATAVDEPPPAGVTVQVLSAGGDRFEPAELVIGAGQTVTWEWPAGSVDHNIVPDDGTTPATSGEPTDGPDTHIYTFDTPGVYRYYCVTHGAPDGIGHSGTVTVLEGAP